MVATLRTLVTAKAYPAISTNREVDCVAGIRLGRDTPEWVRLFPVAFRDLPFSRQFSKYQVIRLEARRHSGDRRPETMRPKTDSLLRCPHSYSTSSP